MNTKTTKIVKSRVVAVAGVLLAAATVVVVPPLMS